MKRWLLLLLIIVCWTSTGLVIFGFQGDTERNVDASASPGGRIVSASPNLTEILFALGLGEEIVGVTLRSNHPQEATEKPKIGTFWQPSIEAVIAAKPDLIITLAFEQQKNLARRLRRIGYNTLTVKIEKVSELFGAIEKIGEVTGKELEAERLSCGIRGKLRELSASVGEEEKIRVLWVVQREPLRAAGRETFINEMIELAGGENVLGRTIHKYPPIGAELVYSCGADVIIEPAMSGAAADQQENAVEYWSKFEHLPAVRNKRVYVIDGDPVSRLGPRLYEGVELIARCLRPGLFGN